MNNGNTHKHYFSGHLTVELGLAGCLFSSFAPPVLKKKLGITDAGLYELDAVPIVHLTVLKHVVHLLCH